MKNSIIALLVIFAFSILPEEAISKDYKTEKSPLLPVHDVFLFSESFDESSIVIEDWMKDVNHWETAPEVESNDYSPELENWMIDLDHWISGSSILDENQFSSEDSLHLEDWMTDPLHWNDSLSKICDSDPRKTSSFKST
jgi:hypothetical protein